MSRSLRAAPHRAARPPAPGSGFNAYDYPCRLSAAFFRRKISFPTPRPLHPGACRRRQVITDQSSVSPSSTAAAPNPPSSAAFRAQPSAQTHPLPELLLGQIPIDRQPLTLFRGFVHRRLSDAGPLTGSVAHIWPASETLTASGHSNDYHQPWDQTPKGHRAFSAGLRPSLLRG